MPRDNNKESVHAVENLLTAEKRYRMLFEQSFDAILIINPKTSLPIDFNNRALELMGYSRDEFFHVTLDVFDAADETAGEQKSRAMKTLAEKGDDFEATVYTKNREAKNVIISVRDIEISGTRVSQCIFHEISDSRRAETQKVPVKVKPRNAPEKVKTLNGLLPICSFCKKVRDEKGLWHHIEAYISERSEAMFSHGLCTGCAKKNYPDYQYEGKQDG